jgi:membrane protein required for colicin V production
MDGFTLIDGIVALVIVVSALLAYSRGFVREALSIAGWIGAAILASVFASQAEPLVKELPIIGGFIDESCELAIIAAFAAVFALALVIMSIITPLFSSLVQRSVLGELDQGIGFLFGMFRGIVLVAVAFFVYDVVLSSQNIDMIDNSRSVAVFGKLTGQVEERNPEQALGWVTAQYEILVGECGAAT